jgi:hypothetical protein
MDAIKAYIETALRIAEQLFNQAKDPAEQEKLSAIIIGLKIAMDNIVNEY